MSFQEKILDWYSLYKRTLPWREIDDPYKVWVSEIILQQTRVDQGTPYYYRFLETFPDVRSLADASEQSVLNVWKGLGYYSRARNMHLTAQKVVEVFYGVFPKDYHTLIKLKGIGAYTAAAIASRCNNEKIAAIDGNVNRVIARYFGVSDDHDKPTAKVKIALISNQLIPDNHPGDYNQAVMEYGAMVCTPALPKCDTCIFQQECYALQNDQISKLPTPKNKIQIRIRYFNYLHLMAPDGRVALNKRVGNDIWKNLWDFPLIEAERLFDANELENSEKLKTITANITGCANVKDYIYKLSHQTLNVRFFTYYLSDLPEMAGTELVWVNPDTDKVPVPRLIEKFLLRNDIFFE
ncbi:MAG: A/G-specific adenine glycosylase [Lentimicrobiaceae bacterium]